jgi:RimJ/RimL family protein N-acetyltransferase
MTWTPPVLPAPLEFDTERLSLRVWQDRHRAALAALNADAEVMRYFPSLQTAAQTDAGIDAWLTQFREQGWSNWAVERRDNGECIGFVGLSVPRRVLPFSPCVEIGWRLQRSAWGHGYATEAARACLRVGFETLGLAEIVSFTALGNAPSRAVMQRIGMHDAHQDFEHPALPEGHPLRPHCLYRLTRSQWRQQAIASTGSAGSGLPARRPVAIVPVAESLAASFHACLDTVAREQRFLAQIEAMSPERIEGFVRQSVADDAVQFFAVDGDTVVGWADVFPAWAHAVRHVGSLGMGVLPAYRGQGLGRRLLQACIDKARSRSITRIELEARADNLAAIQLYQHMGFEHEALKRRAMRFGGRYFDAVQMSLLLDEAGTPGPGGPG